jgi:peptidoglycan/LPS O-acetylase OafA/YrhL
VQDRSTRFIPHVQGLRAIAVALVVLYHFWPGRITGGYIGVDVFFVISGFLITGHLMRELEQTGRVKLREFWARRARRLLPAALLVLLFCAIVVSSPYLTPISSIQREVKEIVASTFYVENWYLAATSADYLNHTSDPTTVQHYWSLSLEEQFYVLWPLLILLAAWIGVKLLRGRTRRALVRTRRSVVLMVVLVTIASLIFGIVLTLADPAPAYFVTFGRMWEFGLGALIALVPALQVRQPVVSFVLGWGGVIALGWAAFRFDGQTLFPGYAALVPALGAAAIIAASNTRRWWYPTRILGVRPMRFVGDISYSLYLWHWPLIIIAPSVPFWGLSIYHRLALLAICVILAWLTKRFVEDPARRWKVLTVRRGAFSLWTSLAAMVVVGAVAVGGWAINAPAYNQGVAALAQLRDNPPSCFGAQSVLDASCSPTANLGTILPAPGFAGADAPSDASCFLELTDSVPAVCDFGSTDPSAPRVALVGDSHAYQLLPTFKRIAEEKGWHLVTYLKGACPLSTTPLSTPGAFGDACTAWREAVTKDLSSSSFAAVYTASLASTPYAKGSYPSVHAAAVAGYQQAWQSLTSRGIPVITAVDNPAWETDPNKCLRTRAESACTGARADLLDPNDPVRDAASGQNLVTLLDFTDVYCTATTCSPVIGGANVYRDQDHLTVTWVDTLKPEYEAALEKAIAAKSS